MQKLGVNYWSRGQSLVLRVPEMGLTPREWAAAVFAATHIPHTTRYGVPGAQEVAHAMSRLPRERVLRMAAGDRVTVDGRVVQCLAVEGDADAWGVRTAVFSDPEVEPLPAGPRMYVDAEAAPPEAVAYCEDERDRLWTGRGAGTWRCLTDPAGRTAPGQWASVWREYGPLVPLVPVRVE